MKKNYYEELMEKYENWEDLVKDLIKDRLKDYKDNSYYGCDLAYQLFEGENIDCSFTYSVYWSKQLIIKYWEDFDTLYEEYLWSMGNENVINILESPERFVVIMLLEQASQILSKNEFIENNWNEEIELNDENIKEIVKELE